MSVGDFADLFLKAIRDLARQYNKQVRFEVQGGMVQADIALLERLREPFVHLFRNAIAHGIESPDERIKAGKEAEGKIALEARSERDSLLITIGDDGRGIKRSAIVEYLKDNRSMTEEQIARMPQEEFFNTILSPDFSSAPETTDMAGRGIGMNVVAQAIEYLGGCMTIRSQPSKGTEFTLKLPISLSVIYAVTFRIGKYTLSVPTSNVESIDRANSLFPDEGSHFYDLRGLLGADNSGRESFYAVRLRYPAQGRGHTRPPCHSRCSGAAMGNDGRIMVIVDSIIGNRSLMVMPIGELLARAKIFAGVGIMENGDISILLDVENLPQVRSSPIRGSPGERTGRKPGMR